MYVVYRKTKTDVTRAIFSRDFVARVRDFIALDKVADAATVELHAATLSRNS